MTTNERGPYSVDDYTRNEQARASDPSHSAWVMANAGSGKTKVLSDRVIRLLLAGCDPSRILCLTFTNAAAGEMSIRVFERLSKWTTVEEAVLAKELHELTGRAASPTDLLAARRLFARALETPGGLKIQTIHAFCEALLHAFPLEANVPGTFELMDEQAQAALIADVTQAMLAAFYQQPDSEAAQAFSRMSHAVSDHAVDELFCALIGERDALTGWLDAHGSVDAAIAATCAAFDIPADASVETMTRDLVQSSSLSREEWLGLRDVAAQGSSTMVTLAGLIERFVDGEEPDNRLAALKECLLKQDGAVRAMSRLVTNAVENALPGIRERLAAEAERLLAGLDRLRSFHTINRTRDGLIVGRELLTRFQIAKRASGMLDYNDLIAGAARLLGSSSARDWVLYKLDAGLDHILLDEAQDTSPLQWDVVVRLAGDFFSGKTAREGRRTIFAVGDEKQSIYSFQGARPEQFSAMRAHFRQLATAADPRSFADARLDRSFRSTEDVLEAVDRVFAQPFAFTGLDSENAKTLHQAARMGKPGAVEVWPLVVQETGDEPDGWAASVDQSSNRHQAVVAAEKVADRIALWLQTGEHLCAINRPITPADILVLVRSRDRFATTLTRLLKERDVPVAGTDRLALTDHIAVQDLLALGRVVINTGDDLSLAALMKSPLLGLSEDDVYTLARARLEAEPQRSLYAELERAAQTGEFAHLAEAHEKLVRWRARADAVAPYEFFANVLGADGGRKQFYARLGLQAQDVLDAFLDQALAHEQGGVPGLQAFAEEMEAFPPTIKRELAKGAQGVRIMTVHGAKGLEAPIVFLVDKTAPYHQARHLPKLVAWGDRDGGPQDHGWLWIPAKGDHIARTVELTSEMERRDADEHRRLLYVGMTRAEDRLIVCGYTGKDPTKTDKLAETWHGLVSSGLREQWQLADALGNPLAPDAQEAAANDNSDKSAGADPNGWTTHVWQRPDRSPRNSITTAPAAEATDRPAALPAWVHHRMAKPDALPRPLSPSGAQALVEEPVAPAGGAARASSLAGGLDARTRGTLVHHLLQWLPEHEAKRRRALALSYLEGAADQLPADTRAVIVDQIIAVLEAEDLKAFFTPGASLAEVPVMGSVMLGGAPRSVGGTIDRLLVQDDAVWALDFKTGAHVPKSAQDVAAVYVTQMALYRALLQSVYPDHACRAALLYTAAADGPRLVELSAQQMDAALHALSQAVVSGG